MHFYNSCDSANVPDVERAVRGLPLQIEKENLMPPFARILALGAALLLAGQAMAAERLELRIGDQKGNMRAQLEAADALRDLPYDIRWSEFPAAAPLAEALNAGAIDAGIIGDAPLLFALAAGARVKAIAVDKSDAYGTAVLVNADSAFKSAADLKGKRIATGRGSIGHYVALKALASVGLDEKDVELRFLGPVDAKMALANGSVDAWATWEPYTALSELSGQAKVLVNGRGLSSGNSFLAATDKALGNAAHRAALQDYLARLAKAQVWAYQHLDSYSRTLAGIIGFPENAARLQFERRQMRWQSVDSATVEQQQETADFYQAHGLIGTRLDVAPTFAKGFDVPADEQVARQP
jgi:sulfonate transport system substrate-binding protein